MTSGIHRKVVGLKKGGGIKTTVFKIYASLEPTYMWIHEYNYHIASPI